jgi:hypothetical protein
MHWTAHIELVYQFFTMEGAVILDAVGSAAGWELRVLFPDRDDVRTTTDFCDNHNLTLTIHSIRQLSSETARTGSARFGLTADQHEALTRAYEQGYSLRPGPQETCHLRRGGQCRRSPLGPPSRYSQCHGRSRSRG